MKFRCFGNRTPDETELEKSNRQIAKEAAIEGMVLLKNEDNVLPLKNRKIALYGNGAKMTIKGGTGSGDVRERYSVNIYDGLKNNGFEILSDGWINRFDEDYNEKKRKFTENIEKNIKKYNIFQTMQMFIYIGNQHLAYPTATKIEDNDLVDTDTCVYVLSRQAGEGKDRELIKGDYYLTDIEKYNIEKCSKRYKNFVLIINSGSIIDLSFIEEEDIKGIIYMSLAGEEGGNALGEILSGKVSPSGKLSDTWGRLYEDYPCFDTFSSLREDESQDDYKEGIFVGYRYFNKKNIKPLFPFGYGLSYANFDIEFIDEKIEKSKITLKFKAKNTSDIYSGKEVVQVYLSKPEREILTEDISLTCFVKTPLLSPQKECLIETSFDLKDFAIFDENSKQYLLENGIYAVFFSNSSQNLMPVLNLKVEKDFVLKKVNGVGRAPQNIASLTFNTGLKKQYNVKTIEIKEISKDEVFSKHDFTKVDKILNRLTNKELIKLVCGGGYGGKYYNRVMGAAGRTTSDLIKKGIPNICLSDGPAGINVIQKIGYTKRGGTRYIDELPKDWQWGWIKKYGRLFISNKKSLIRVYNYATAFPCETLLAQTFNKDLIYKVGRAVGKEMLNFGVSIWLAPGVNIHRNPLCGRNFEYCSEDPILTSEIISSLVNGVQDCGGVGVTIKHFCCNNEENYRTKVSANLSERALREIYLKPFKMIIKKSNPVALMSSYNRVNGYYVVNSYDLLTKYLREEIGYQGLIMSDWNATDNCSHYKALKAGNNLIMPGNKKVRKELVKNLKEGKLTRQDLLNNAKYVLEAVLNSEINKEE